MCLIVIAWKQDRDFPLIVAANRDEFLRRPTEPAHWWDDAPDVLAGRDRQRGGTWLGITRTGRIAMVTNYREPPAGPPAPESRGALVADYLRGPGGPGDYLRGVARRRRNFDGFNLIAGDAVDLWYLGHREAGPRPLEQGIHGVSNGDMDARWPKVRKATEHMGRAIAQGQGSDAQQRRALLNEALLALLADGSTAPESELPDTGVGLDWERRLSPIFVHSDGYGTRSSTVVLVDRAGAVCFHERTYDGDGNPAGDAVYGFQSGQKGGS